MERAERQGDTGLVAELKYEILPDKMKRLQKLQEEQESYEKKEHPMISDTVGPEQIAEVDHIYLVGGSSYITTLCERAARVYKSKAKDKQKI